MENGEINCTSIAASSLEPRTYVHTYKFFHVRAPARSHFSSPTFDSSLLLLVVATDVYNHDSSVNLSLLSIDAHDISSNDVPFSFDNCRYLRTAASFSYCWFVHERKEERISKTRFKYHVRTVSEYSSEYVRLWMFTRFNIFSRVTINHRIIHVFSFREFQQRN